MARPGINHKLDMAILLALAAREAAAAGDLDTAQRLRFEHDHIFLELADSKASKHTRSDKSRAAIKTQEVPTHANK